MPWLVEFRSLEQPGATRLRSFLRAKAFSDTRSEVGHRISVGIGKIRRFQELSYEEWPEWESNPRHADFQGVSGLSAECGERLSILQQGLTFYGIVAQHQLELSRNVEFRYFSGTESGKRIRPVRERVAPP
jgi:hypothetical protein